MNTNTLDKLPIGIISTVLCTDFDGLKNRHMIDLGIISGAKIKALHKSPGGDLCAYGIRGAVIALRLEDAQKISIC